MSDYAFSILDWEPVRIRGITFLVSPDAKQATTRYSHGTAEGEIYLRRGIWWEKVAITPDELLVWFRQRGIRLERFTLIVCYPQQVKARWPQPSPWLLIPGDWDCATNSDGWHLGRVRLWPRSK